MSTNFIHNLKTVAIESEGRTRVAVVKGLNIPDDDAADAFVEEAAEKFKLQRMCSPPETDVLLITVIGNVAAPRFAARWRQIAASDAILGSFMSQMRQAEVVRGRPDGTPLESISLIDAPPLPTAEGAAPANVTTLFTGIAGAGSYDSAAAYQRWRGKLGPALAAIRARYSGFRRIGFGAPIHIFGRAVWGVFVRAFWPIYMGGKRGHHGSVVASFDPFFEDSPGLFEISEDLRRLRESSNEPKSVEKFARILRNDYRAPARVTVPKELTTGRKVFFQSVFIPRSRLPGGYLHHRLVPIVASRIVSAAQILPLKFWPPEFQRIWQLGEPLLPAETLAEYQRRSPTIRP
jgi:hypothetical protein